MEWVTSWERASGRLANGSLRLPSSQVAADAQWRGTQVTKVNVKQIGSKFSQMLSEGRVVGHLEMSHHEPGFPFSVGGRFLRLEIDYKETRYSIVLTGPQSCSN